MVLYDEFGFRKLQEVDAIILTKVQILIFEDRENDMKMPLLNLRLFDGNFSLKKISEGVRFTLDISLLFRYYNLRTIGWEPIIESTELTLKFLKYKFANPLTKKNSDVLQMDLFVGTQDCNMNIVFSEEMITSVMRVIEMFQNYDNHQYNDPKVAKNARKGSGLSSKVTDDFIESWLKDMKNMDD